MRKTPLSPELEEDEGLMRDLRRHRPVALRKLYDRYHHTVYAVAMHILGDPTDTEEVTQDVFIQLWQRAEHYTPRKGKPIAWLLTLTRRRAIDRIRRRTAYSKAVERFEVGTRIRVISGIDRRTLGGDTEQSDLRHYLDEIVERLPLPQQEMIEQAYFRGMSQREIAAASHLPLGTVKTRLELALQKLSGIVGRRPDKVR